MPADLDLHHLDIAVRPQYDFLDKAMQIRLHILENIAIGRQQFQRIATNHRLQRGNPVAHVLRRNAVAQLLHTIVPSARHIGRTRVAVGFGTGAGGKTGYSRRPIRPNRLIG